MDKGIYLLSISSFLKGASTDTKFLQLLAIKISFYPFPHHQEGMFEKTVVTDIGFHPHFSPHGLQRLSGCSHGYRSLNLSACVPGYLMRFRRHLFEEQALYPL